MFPSLLLFLFYLSLSLFPFVSILLVLLSFAIIKWVLFIIFIYYISTPGLCQCRSTGPLSDHSRVVLDVSIVHSTTRSAASGFAFQKDKIALTETRKVKSYDDNYSRRSLAFGPLIADSIGQIGSSALRFFHRVARFCSSANGASTSQSDSFASALYHRLRLSFLHATFEATAERLLRVGPLEAASSCARSATPVSSALSASAAPLPSPLSSQPSTPLVVFSPSRRTQDNSTVILANACFVPFPGPAGTDGSRVSLVPLPTVLRIVPAPSGSQPSLAAPSPPALASVVPASAGAAPALGSDFPSLPGSPALSAPASGSQQLPASGSQPMASGSPLPAPGPQPTASASQLMASGSQLTTSGSSPTDRISQILFAGSSPASSASSSA